MAGPLVLVIEDDDWVSRLLSVAIEDAGFTARTCGAAQEGLDFARKHEPDCIVCDVDLPDHDGFWMARNVRTSPGRVSVTPFLFLSSLDDEESRLRGFHVGADVYMTKPFRVDEVVAQVGALVQMAQRLRARRETLASLPPFEGTAIEGDLAQMSIATVLTVLEMERRSGIFTVVSKKRHAQLELLGGVVVGARIGGTSAKPISVVGAMMGYNVGRFSFRPTTSDGPPPSTELRVGQLLLDAARIQDEQGAGFDLPPESQRSRSVPERLVAPTLGGKGSDLADMAPPSSRAAAAPEPPLSLEGLASGLGESGDPDDEEPISVHSVRGAAMGPTTPPRPPPRPPGPERPRAVPLPQPKKR